MAAHADGRNSRNVLIIGAGILAQSMAEVFAGEQNVVINTNRKIEKAEAVAEQLKEKGVNAVPAALDVLDRNSIRKLAAWIKQEYGVLTTVIISAGGNMAPVLTGDIALDDDKLLDVAGSLVNLNYLGTVYCTQIFGAMMLEQDVPASIVLIGSASALKEQPLSKVVYYGGAKAAVHHYGAFMARHFAEDRKRSDIRVNVIVPGFFRTEQNEPLLFENPNTPEEKPTPRCEQILAKTPFGRLGRPEELKGAVEFLCDPDKSSFISGQLLVVDGAWQTKTI